MYVVRSVSLDCPQLTPARAHMIFNRDLARSVRSLRCGVKVKLGSRVTPRILGLRQRGSGSPPSETPGSVRNWWESEVKRVTWDFAREIVRPLSSAHAATSVA